jgi:HlyD family secretion protein
VTLAHLGTLIALVACPPGVVMRVVGPLLVLVLVLSLAIAYRLRAEKQAQEGPSGGSGVVEASPVDLSSRVGARILAVNAREGQQVKRGDVLVQLDCSEPSTLLLEARARLAVTRAQAMAAGANVVATERSRATAWAAQQAARAQAAALQAQQDAAERQAQRLESIPKDVPASSVDQTRSVAIGLSHQVEAAKAQANVSAAQARVVSGQIDASTAQAAAAEAQVGAAEAAVTRAEVFVSECEVRAPLDATVASLPQAVGELASPGSVLVRLIDSDELLATFYLPNSELGAAKPGQAALVVADAWPGEQFQAEIQTVAFEAEFTPRNIQTRSDRDRLVYPVEVRITGGGGKLRAGMPVQVTLPGTEGHRGGH